jgi:hypothetical protein
VPATVVTPVMSKVLAKTINLRCLNETSIDCVVIIRHVYLSMLSSFREI